MRDIAKLNENDKKALFHNTAAKMGMTDAIIEKDFWVCYMLDYLFHRCAWKNNIAFKGGTSLSKSYGLIERFSEDIDLILDWRVLGYEKDEPWADRSNTKQDAFNKEAGTKTEAFLRNEFMPAVCDQTFAFTSWKWSSCRYCDLYRVLYSIRIRFYDRESYRTRTRP